MPKHISFQLSLTAESAGAARSQLFDQIKRRQIGLRHFFKKPLSIPGPCRRHPLCIEVPALAARSENRLPRRRDPLFLKLLQSRLTDTDLATPSRLEQFDELGDVMPLMLGDFNQRKISDRTIGTIQHKEIGKLWH